MSDYIPKSNRGTVFKNTDEKIAAAWSGKVNIDGLGLYYLDLYPATDRDTNQLRKDRDGNPFYNITLKPVKQPLDHAPAQSDQSGGEIDLSDEIPF